MLTREAYRNGRATWEIDWNKVQDISVSFALVAGGILFLSATAAIWKFMLSN